MTAPSMSAARSTASASTRVEGEMTDLDCQWLERKLKMYGLAAPKGVKNMTKIVAGKQLWNYDNLEPAEKKLVL